MKESTRKKPMTTEELFDKINGILKEKGKLPDILDYGLATHSPVPITNYEFEIRNNLDYGGNEGIYLDLGIEYNEDVKTHRNTAKVECRWAIGLLFPGGISYVTKIENYPSKSFYWDTEDEPLYFDSKRSADDYAFGMLLNGYPVVVMEVPKAIIINNIKKSRKESESNAEISEETKE